MPMCDKPNLPYHHCPYCRKEFKPAIHKFLKSNLVAISCYECGTVISCCPDIETINYDPEEEEANIALMKKIISE